MLLYQSPLEGGELTPFEPREGECGAREGSGRGMGESERKGVPGALPTSGRRVERFTLLEVGPRSTQAFNTSTSSRRTCTSPQMHKRATGKVNSPAQKRMVSRLPVKAMPHFCAILAHDSMLSRDSSEKLAEAMDKFSRKRTDSLAKSIGVRLRKR